MQLRTKMPAFAEFADTLAHADIAISPAEVHGILCSFVCSGQRLNGTSWLDTLLHTLGLGASQFSRQLFIKLYDITCRQLGGLERNFQLLLPDMATSFTACALALSYWCKGFSYGLEVADVLDLIYAGRGSIETQAAVDCIAEVGDLDFEEIETSVEHDKVAYHEVVNYVRAAALRLYAELSVPASTNPQSALTSAHAIARLH